VPPVLITQHAPDGAPPAATQRFAAIAAAARNSGWQVVHQPADHAGQDWVPSLTTGAPVVFSGYVPAPSDYATLHDAVTRAGGHPVNDPQASEQVTHFAGWYATLVDLTPASVIIAQDRDVDRAARELGFPMFVKGAVKSAKEAGWQACVATDTDTLRRRLTDAARRPVSMRGVLIARQIAPLRRNGRLRHDFPISREYRVYLLDGQVITVAPYWEDPDPFGPMTSADHEAVTGLALEGSRRLDAALVCVDVAQCEDGSWILVEVGDPQFTTLANVNPLSFYVLLGDALSRRPVASAR
jgi:hypothetical protein